MKTLVVVASGAADRPLEELGGRTPLEAAATPKLDRLAREGRLGRLTPAPPDVRPEEGAFALGIFGLDPVSYGDIGAVLDAAAYDVPVGSLDQAFRLTLVTADDQTIFDPTESFDTPRAYNLLNDPHERDNVLFPYTWAVEKALPQLQEHLATFQEYPPIPPGTPDPYEPPAN